MKILRKCIGYDEFVFKCPYCSAVILANQYDIKLQLPPYPPYVECPHCGNAIKVG